VVCDQGRKEVTTRATNAQFLKEVERKKVIGRHKWCGKGRGEEKPIEKKRKEWNKSGDEKDKRKKNGG